jgi:hypothetical protein
VLADAGKMGVVIFSVGIFDDVNEDRNPAVLKLLTEATGGQAFFPATPSEIPKICKQIAKDIRHEYTIGFPGAEDGRYHSIRIVVRDPHHGKLHVHARPGYQAAKT